MVQYTGPNGRAFSQNSETFQGGATGAGAEGAVVPFNQNLQMQPFQHEHQSVQSNDNSIIGTQGKLFSLLFLLAGKKLFLFLIHLPSRPDGLYGAESNSHG